MQSRVLPITRWGSYIRIRKFYRRCGIFSAPIRISASLYSRHFLLSQMICRPFSVVANTRASADVTIFIQPEACILPFLRRDLLEEIFNYNIPGADAVISMADALFIDNMQRIKDEKFIIYFTEYGMTRFLQDGLFEESHPRFTIL